MPEEIDLSALEDEGVSQSVIQQLRAQADKAGEMEKHTKRLEKELAEARAFRQEQERRDREAQVRATFRQAGLPEVQADLFLKVSPEGEVTPESVSTFAEQYGLTVPKAPEPEPTSASFAKPIPTQGTPPSLTPTAPPSLGEWKALYARNPQAAMAMAAEMEANGSWPWAQDRNDLLPTGFNRGR